MTDHGFLRTSAALVLAVCLLRLYPFVSSEAKRMQIKETLRDLQDQDELYSMPEPAGCKNLAGILSSETLQMREEIVQGENDQYYLSHLCDGSESENGTLFLSCHSDWQDMNRVIFGHHVFYENIRMTPFFQLLDQNINEEARLFELSTERGMEQYRMIAVLEVDYSMPDIFDYLSGSYSKDELDEYNRHLKEDHISGFFEEVKETDRLLTFLTCRDESGPVRVLFIAKAV
ncbi:MAG: class B sortase [Solobacterium sp.]|nr:class B sortase [Solobacterium sp.]